MFYLGKFNHTLDSKNRLFVPARFREKLGSDFVLFMMPDPCLALYDSDNFDFARGQAGTAGLRYAG